MKKREKARWSAEYFSRPEPHNRAPLTSERVASEARHLSFRISSSGRRSLWHLSRASLGQRSPRQTAPRLGHPPRPRIHPQKQYFLRSFAVALEVLGVDIPCVIKRVSRQSGSPAEREPRALSTSRRALCDIDEQFALFALRVIEQCRMPMANNGSANRRSPCVVTCCFLAASWEQPMTLLRTARRRESSPPGR